MVLINIYPFSGNGPVRRVDVEVSTRHEWVNYFASMFEVSPFSFRIDFGKGNCLVLAFCGVESVSASTTAQVGLSKHEG